MDHFCYLCLVFVVLSCLFIAALWPPAGKGLNSRLSFPMLYCVFATFPCGILGQVWYSIVLILIFATFSFFVTSYCGLGSLKPPCELNIIVLLTAESRAKIWYQLNAFKPLLA